MHPTKRFSPQLCNKEKNYLSEPFSNKKKIDRKMEYLQLEAIQRNKVMVANITAVDMFLLKVLHKVGLSMFALDIQAVYKLVLAEAVLDRKARYNLDLRALVARAADT